MSATPRPWEIVPGSSRISAYIYPQTPKPRPLIAEIPLGVELKGKAEREANARLIVQAVNVHEELVAALKICKAAMDADSDAVANVYEIVTETLAKVERP